MRKYNYKSYSISTKFESHSTINPIGAVQMANKQEQSGDGSVQIGSIDTKGDVNISTGDKAEYHVGGDLITDNARKIATGGDYIEGSQNVQQAEEKPKVSSQKASTSPWTSGSFYLLAICAILIVLIIGVQQVGIVAFPVVIIAGAVLLSIVGALQLRNDSKLSQKNFLELMLMSFTQLARMGRNVKEEDKDKS